MNTQAALTSNVHQPANGRRTEAPATVEALRPPRGQGGRGIYFALRDYLYAQPELLRTARRLRSMALVGPLQGLITARYRSHNAPLATLHAPFVPTFDPVAVARGVVEYGYARVPALAPALADRIVSESGRETIFGAHRRCPTVWALAHDDRVVGAARHYLGAEPHLFESYVVWTPPERHEYKHTFHYDVADVRAISLFVYVTDVDWESGPHQAVAGTHGAKTLADIWTPQVPDAAVAQRFGDRIDTFIGPRGTAFFEDQSVVHRALAGASKLRGTLIVTYTMQRRSPYG